MGPYFFLIIYLVVMLPTYFLRFAAFGAVVDETATIEDALEFGNTAAIILAICYLIMIIISFSRGKKANRPYLVAFPIIGGIFDLLLPFVVLVPTVMNILAIIFGMMNPADRLKG